MDLKKYLVKEAIRLDLAATTKEETLTLLCDQAARLLRIQAPTVLAAVLERESHGSTAVGGGVAIPHGKLAGLNEIFMVLGRTAPGVNLGFDPPDGQPVQIVTLLLSPLAAISEHLKVLALLGRLWKTPKNLGLLLAAPDLDSFYSLFLELAATAA
ncbi:MAG: PTS sugar transporter subunit IIA [Deltaproteobacteria bacterium]|jgi:PTS system nitrogen regulatory IIA component|nr:PTS sugar transporter subunit IIA [Deltaproteobacteria bacterium]